MIFRLGLFDSGIGGFTVLRRVLERHGNIDCIYLGDTARVPYGEKRPSEIREIAKEITEWLCSQRVTAILVACNTTNSLAFDVVRDVSGLPVFGLIDSACGMITQTRVGILATPATTASNTYKSHIKSLNPGISVFQQSCPAFVPLIEDGIYKYDEIRRIATKYLTPLLDQNIEELILGCSHYPLIETLLKELIPKEIRLIDPAIGLAQQLDRYLGHSKHSEMRPYSMSNTKFCVTSDPSGFNQKAENYLGSFSEVQLVSLLPKACFS